MALLTSLTSCTREALHKAFATPVLPMSYDDFGPESIARPLLGERGTNPQIVVHRGATKTVAATTGQDAATSTRYLNMSQGMYFLRHQVRKLAQTPENAALRSRLKATYSRLYDYYRTRRDTVMSSPTVGRGAAARNFIVPPMPPYL